METTIESYNRGFSSAHDEGKGNSQPLLCAPLPVITQSSMSLQKLSAELAPVLRQATGSLRQGATLSQNVFCDPVLVFCLISGHRIMT